MPAVILAPSSFSSWSCFFSHSIHYPGYELCDGIEFRHIGPVVGVTPRQCFADSVDPCGLCVEHRSPFGDEPAAHREHLCIPQPKSYGLRLFLRVGPDVAQHSEPFGDGTDLLLGLGEESARGCGQIKCKLRVVLRRCRARPAESRVRGIDGSLTFPLIVSQIGRTRSVELTKQCRVRGRDPPALVRTAAMRVLTEEIAVFAAAAREGRAPRRPRVLWRPPPAGSRPRAECPPAHRSLPIPR